MFVACDNLSIPSQDVREKHIEPLSGQALGILREIQPLTGDGKHPLREQGWHRDAVERQLAHAERDSIRAAYNYAQHMPERRRMMQAWADYLED